jgi:hypothetical protein
MKCSYFNKELDEDRKIGYICSCELGYFGDENPHAALEQFCTNCDDKETDNTNDDLDDDED